MSYYYPQGAVELRILPEDYKLVSDATLQATRTLRIQARDITVKVNDYKTTDTFSLEIDYKHFPFDPRTIRACGVVIFMQDMEGVYKDDGSVNTIVPNGPTKVNPDIPNAVFIGFADDETIEFDDLRRTVRLEGRDCTALLIDQKYAENAPISLNVTLDVAIQTLIATFPATKNIAVINNTGDTLPTLAQYYPDFGSPLAGQKNPGKHESYWEIIQDIANRAGLICYMGRSLTPGGTIVPAIILSTPKNQIVKAANGETVDDIKVIYGINVKNLKLKRKLGRFKGFNLQVRSRVGKDVLIAKIPEEATVEWGVGFGFQLSLTQTSNFDPVQVPVLKPDGSLDTTQTHVAPYITFPVPNVGNKDALIKIGQTTYEQYSMQQLEGSFDTFEMLGRGTTKDSNVDNKASFKVYDLTQIKKGQTICLEIDADDLDEISRLSSVETRTEYLKDRNYDPVVAAIFAKTMGKFSPRFQIKNYVMNINQTNGWKLTIEFQNVVDTTHRGLS